MKQPLVAYKRVNFSSESSPHLATNIWSNWRIHLFETARKIVPSIKTRLTSMQLLKLSKIV